MHGPSYRVLNRTKEACCWGRAEQRGGASASWLTARRRGARADVTAR